MKKYPKNRFHVPAAQKLKQQMPTSTLRQLQLANQNSVLQIIKWEHFINK
jgi:hypothetical protein